MNTTLMILGTTGNDLKRSKAWLDIKGARLTVVRPSIGDTDQSQGS